MREPRKDPVDGRKYATDNIRWFIKRGDTIEENIPLKIDCERKAHFQNPNQSWVDTIVTSRQPPDCLPQFLGHGDSRPVCRVESRSGLDTLIPKRKYRIIGKKYLTGKYEMSVFVDEDDLKFETRVNGKLVGEYRTDQVLWDYAED